MARVGDTLGPENLDTSVARQLALGFPPAEQARFAASLQARGLLPAAASPFLILHPAVLLLGGAGTLLAWWQAARAGDMRRLGLVLSVLVGITVNAAVTGALSGPHDRYQARIAWLLPLAALLALPERAAPLPARIRPSGPQADAATACAVAGQTAQDRAPAARA
jgi:hypothetical protein